MWQKPAPFSTHKLLSIALFCSLSLALTIAEASGKRYKAVEIEEFDSTVWGFSFINKTELLVTLKKGKLLHIDRVTKKRTPLPTPKIVARGQSGLLDVLFLPTEKKNWVFFTFSEKHQGMFTTSLARAIWKEGSLTDLKTIFRAKIYGTGSYHFGSRLVFKDDSLFMTIGDRGERKYAQNLKFHNGKILRLTLDGKPHPANPFLKSTEALPEIWSYGHRNPQGIDTDPVSQKLFSVEFGPRGGDELNQIEKAKNYGWPEATYGSEYWGPSIGVETKEGMESPVTHWTPSISPSGMAFYTANQIPEWKNHLFLACLGSRHLRRLKMANGKVIEQEKLFAPLGERIRHVRTGADGGLYFSTDSGKIYRVEKVSTGKSPTPKK